MNRALRKTKELQIDYMLRALEWLAQNNKKWKNINLDDYRKELEDVTPNIIDKSHIVESENENVDRKE